MSAMLSNPLSHKHEESPFQRSLSSVSTSTPSPSHNSHPSSSVGTLNSNLNGNGYQVYGVSPPEGSTASASGLNGGNGPNSTIESGDINIKKDMNEFAIHDMGPSSEFSVTPVDQQQQQISAPNSQMVVIKDPFDDDYDTNLPSVPSTYSHQPTGPVSHQMMEQMQLHRQNMYPISDRNILQRYPYAFNRPQCPPYPVPPEFSNNPAAYLNRSQPYPHSYPFPMPLIRPMMPCAMTPGTYGGQPPTSIPQPPPTKKSKSKAKQNQSQQQIPPVIPPIPPMGNPMMMRNSMEMMRHPAFIAQQMAIKNNQLMMSNQRSQPHRTTAIKVVQDGPCASCQSPITGSNCGIRCTALNQGCLQTYHLQCAKIEPLAFRILYEDKDIEWVCHLCSSTKQLIWSVP